MVNQQVVLFNRTVRENIAYGQLENATDAEIIAAAKAAYAHDLLWLCHKVMIRNSAHKA